MNTILRPLVALMFLAFVSSAGADEAFDILPVGSITYTNVTVTDVTATDIYFTYSRGMGNAKLKDLPPALQQHFHYNQRNASAAEQQQAQANIQYKALAAAQQGGEWGRDLPAAFNQAQAEHKLVLLYFTGSDWCPVCKAFDEEEVCTPEFASYAGRNLVLVKLDFLHHTPQSEALKAANGQLYNRFHVQGFPTCILLDANGKELWRQAGYAGNSPETLIGQLSPFSNKTDQSSGVMARLAHYASALLAYLKSIS